MFMPPIGPMVECSPMAWETGVKSLVESYQRLKKKKKKKKKKKVLDTSLLSIIRYVSRVKWNNLGKSSVQ